MTWGGPRVPLTGRRIVLVERTPQERTHWLHGDEHGSREGCEMACQFSMPLVSFFGRTEFFVCPADFKTILE